MTGAATPRRRRLFRAGLAAALGLALAEAASRAALSLPAVRASVLRADCSPCWLAAWTAERPLFRRPSTALPYDVHHPTRGWTLAPGLKDDRSMGWSVSSNSLGLRDDAERTRRKPPGVRRVAVFGDSFTFGDEVDTDETYAHRLRGMLPGVEVLNFGVHGYGHDQMLLSLREDGVGFAPDVVVLGFVGSDKDRNLLSFRDFAKPRFVLRGGSPVLTGVPVPAPRAVRLREAAVPRLFRLGQIAASHARPRSYAEEDRLTEVLLAEFERTARAAGARVLFLYLPAVHGPELAPGGSDAGEAWFRRLCAARGWEFVSATEKLLAGGVGPSDRPRHYDAREHLLVAECLRDRLRS
jgi:hypothetical protein